MPPPPPVGPTIDRFQDLGECLKNKAECITSLIDFRGSWLDKQLVGAAGLAAAELADRPFWPKEGGIRVIENCDSPFCKALFAAAGVGAENLEAVTIGDTILGPGYIDPGTLKHEAEHVRQYRELGFIGFMFKYFGEETAKNAIGCLSDAFDQNVFTCIYHRNALEREAEEAEGR